MKRIIIIFLLALSTVSYGQNAFNWIYLKEYTASGTDTYTVTIPLVTLVKDLVIKIKFANDNTGASTLNVNSLGAKNIYKEGTTALAAGDIKGTLILSFDGTNFYIPRGGITVPASAPPTTGSFFLRGNGTGGFTNLTTPSDGSLIMKSIGATDFSDSGLTGDGTNITLNSGASPKRFILTANNNVARILSFRTANTQRWALRVDGNETGTNTGADFFIRRYDDAGAFIDAPLDIPRASGIPHLQNGVRLKSSSTAGYSWVTSDALGNGDWSQVSLTAGVSGILPVANGGTGSSTIPFWSLSTGGTLTGANTISGGSIRNPFTYTGSWTTNASGQYFTSSSPIITLRATTSDEFAGHYFGGSITSGANSQTLRGALFETSLINGGAHTGLVQDYLTVRDSSQPTRPMFKINSSVVTIGNTENTQTLTLNSSAASTSITGTGNSLNLNHSSIVGFNVGADIMYVRSNSSGFNVQILSNGSSASSTATQKNSFNLNFTTSEWNGTAANPGFWTHRATVSTTTNQLSYYDIYNGQSSAIPSLSNLHLRISSAGNLLIGAGTSTTLTPSARVHIRGSGTTTGKNLLLEDNTGAQTLFVQDNGSMVLGSGAVTNANTILDIQSTTKGVAFPRMTTTQRDAITSPYSGLFFYNSTTNELNYHNGTSWGSVNRLKNYTVATLPTGTQGDTAYVTDALTPTYLTTVVGGGAVVTPVFYNGTNWVCY